MERVAEQLGTGVRNLYHYAPIYLGAEPTITDDDMFRIRLNIAESKRAELAIPTTECTTESSETGGQTGGQTTEQIFELWSKKRNLLLLQKE